MNLVLGAIGLTLLVVLNIFLFAIILWASKGKTDLISKMGFGFMEFVILVNSIVIIGGAATWAF